MIPDWVLYEKKKKLVIIKDIIRTVRNLLGDRLIHY